MGQKVPVERPRVRSTDDQEVRLGSYEMFHRGEPLPETVWEKLMLGLSTRKYGQAVREFTEAYGLEKSAVSEHFIEASRAKLQEMMERRLDKTRLCALLLYATPFAGQQLMVAMGISQDGRKMILGLRQGATENATVVGELLGDLVNRGLDFSEPRLYILDGGKALTAAVKKHAGESAAIQRCQVHKRRNVLDHLTDEQKPTVAQRLNAAYALEDYAAAKQALNSLHRELMELNPSAARSLGEGMEETLTVHRLHVPMQLRKTLASTNVIESAFSIVEQVCKNVKRWHGGDQRERWVGSGLLVAQHYTVFRNAVAGVAHDRVVAKHALRYLAESRLRAAAFSALQRAVAVPSSAMRRRVAVRGRPSPRSAWGTPQVFPQPSRLAQAYRRPGPRASASLGCSGHDFWVTGDKLP
jgi:hypothetical protein